MKYFIHGICKDNAIFWEEQNGELLTFYPKNCTAQLLITRNDPQFMYQLNVGTNKN